MHYFVISLILQSLKELNSKSSYQTKTNALKIVVLNELIQVNTEKFKRNYQMTTKDFKVVHSYDVVFVVRIIIIKVL